MRELWQENGAGCLGFVLIAMVVLGLIGGALWAWPGYNIYRQQAAGEAQLREAEFTRQIAELDGRARVVRAEAEAAAEVARARGAAEANQILADSLEGKDEYLRYLYIEMLRESNGAGREIIYIPTEGGLPLLEAGRAVTGPGIVPTPTP